MASLGIDFGTCLSSAALVVQGRPEPVKFGPNLTSLPSSVFMDREGKLWIGEEAENQRQLDPSSYRRELKRYLGTGPPIYLGNTQVMPEVLIAEIYRRVKSAAEAQFQGKEELSSAIITVPATYKPSKRSLMEEAAREAGFKEVELLEEPVAAALYYAWAAGKDGRLAEGENLLVYDLGGSTFDAAVLTSKRNNFTTLAPAVSFKCGGVDFDRELFNYIQKNSDEALQTLLASDEDKGSLARLLITEMCRKIKHRLSSEPRVKEIIILPETSPKNFTIERTEFEAMITPLIEQTIDLCGKLLESAGLKATEINKFVLVGGCCRIPYVKQAIERTFARPVVRVGDPELAVCLGAALHGAKNTRLARASQSKRKPKPDASLIPKSRSTAQKPGRRHDYSVALDRDKKWDY